MHESLQIYTFLERKFHKKNTMVILIFLIKITTFENITKKKKKKKHVFCDLSFKIGYKKLKF